MVTLYSQLRGGGDPVAIFPDATISDWSYWRDKPGTCNFSLSARRRPAATLLSGYGGYGTLGYGDADYKASDSVPVSGVLQPGVHEIVIVENGKVVWCGPVLPMDETLASDDSDGELKFAAADLRHYFDRMVLGLSVATDIHPIPVPGATIIASDQHLMIRDIIDLQQSRPGGDFGLDTTAITASGTVRQKQWPVWGATYVSEVVEHLTGIIGGPDLWVDPASRQVRLATPRRGGRRKEAIYNDRNIRGGTRRIDGAGQASEAVGLGAGIEEDRLRVTRRSSSAVATYGLTQTRRIHSTIERTGTLAERLDEHLSGTSSPPNLLSIDVATDEPPIETLSWGDEVRVHVNSPWKAIDEFQRIVGITRRPAADGAEPAATLHLEPLT